MDLKIDYQTLTDDDLRQLIAEATAELDRRRTLADTPARIAALYQRIEDAGGDMKQADNIITAERATLTEQAVRARAVEPDETKPVETKPVESTEE